MMKWITWGLCFLAIVTFSKEPEPTNSPGRSIIVTTNMLNGIQLYPGYITFTNCNLLNSNLMSLGTAIWASNTAYWSSNALVNGASLSNALHIGNNAYAQDILGVNNLYSYNSVVSNYLTLITNLTLGVTPMTTAGATEDDFLLKTITGDYYYNNSPLYSYTNLVSGNTNYNVGEWSTYNSSLPHWVKITPGVSYALGTFKILPTFNVHSYLKTFMISGSVDNVNWVQIYSNEAPDVQGWYTAATTNTVNYTYYWFTIAGPIWTGENYTRLISIQGYKAVTGTVYSVVVVPYGTSPSLFDVTSWNTVGAVSNTAAWASNNVHSWASNANVSAMASNATYATTANVASNLTPALSNTLNGITNMCVTNILPVVTLGTTNGLSFATTGDTSIASISFSAAGGGGNNSYATNADVAFVASNLTTAASNAFYLAGVKVVSATNADYATTANTASNLVAGYKPASSTNSDYATTANTASNVVSGYKPASATNADYATWANTASNLVGGWKIQNATNADYATWSGTASNLVGGWKIQNATNADVATYAVTANTASNLVAGYKPAASTNADYATYAGTASNLVAGYKPASSTNSDYATTANTASNVVAGYKPAASTNADYAVWANTASNLVAGYKPASSTNSDYATTANVASNVTSAATNAIGSLLISSNTVWTGTSNTFTNALIVGKSFTVNGPSMLGGGQSGQDTNGLYISHSANSGYSVAKFISNWLDGQGGTLLRVDNASGNALTVDANRNVTVPGILYGGTNYCMVYLSTNVNVAQGVYTKVPYDTVITNIGGGWSTANRYFKPNVKGIYYVSACVDMGPASASAIYWMIYKNGSILYEGRWATSVLAEYSTMSCLVSMNGSSDYLEVYGRFYNATGIYYSDGSSGPFFCAFLLQKEP